jgi:hypothetical protein
MIKKLISCLLMVFISYSPVVVATNDESNGWSTAEEIDKHIRTNGFVANVRDSEVEKPNKKLTPGDTVQISLEVLCKTGYTDDARDVSDATKRKVYELYKREKKAGVCCEVDHLIPLAIGGSNDIKNLWPQPYEPRPGAYEKDVVEMVLRREVCEGRLDIKKAQKEITKDWYRVYKHIKKEQAKGRK